MVDVGRCSAPLAPSVDGRIYGRNGGGVLVMHKCRGGSRSTHTEKCRGGSRSTKGKKNLGKQWRFFLETTALLSFPWAGADGLCFQDLGYFSIPTVVFVSISQVVACQRLILFLFRRVTTADLSILPGGVVVCNRRVRQLAQL